MIRKEKLFIVLAFILFGLVVIHSKSNMYYVQAEAVHYSYDILGRVKTAVYPDGTEITYSYDKNGNIVEVKKSTTESKDDSNETDSSKPEIGTEHGNEETKPTESIVTPSTQTDETIAPTNPVESVLHDTAKEMKEYNKFKKKKTVIKSLKSIKKNKKRYLKISIKQVSKRGVYGEIGYQIKYATNSKFKKAKTITVTRVKKGSLTSKQWKVSKNKTYHVKVRAYLKTRTGKKIYTKYSNVKKIKITK